MTSAFWPRRPRPKRYGWQRVEVRCCCPSACCSPCRPAPLSARHFRGTARTTLRRWAIRGRSRRCSIRSAALRRRADLSGRRLYRELYSAAGPGFGRRADQHQPSPPLVPGASATFGANAILSRPPDHLLYTRSRATGSPRASDPIPPAAVFRTDTGGLSRGLRAAGHHAGAEWRVQPLQHRRAGTRRRSEILPDPRCAYVGCNSPGGRAAARTAGQGRDAAPDTGWTAVPPRPTRTSACLRARRSGWRPIRAVR